MIRKERMTRMHDKGLSYEDIGQIEGISKQRVSQILKPQKVQAQVPLLLTSGAAAAYLGVHANTLRRWANEGTIESIRLPIVRRDRRFSRQELDRFLQRESHSVKGGDP